MLKKNFILYFLSLFFVAFNSYAANTLLIGDSLMGTISNSYKKINQQEMTDVKYIIGSGLENKKFNWFDYIDNKNLKNYDNIIISIGTNDFSLRDNNDYSKKVKYFLLSIKNKNPKINIYWVGPPTIKNKNINNGVEVVRDIIIQNTYNQSVKFIDVRKILGYKYNPFRDNQKIRANDGIHYTSITGDLIVKELNRVMN